ncbi:MAG: DUF3892 domain-containing protein [Desulfosporosinus sp.]|nr:DUF3892 domain-containing protein [Desulfosporosinus sp.]
MKYKITKVRLQTNGSKEEHITHVLISDSTATGTELTVSAVVESIKSNDYYYTTGGGETATVEAVYPKGRDPYIRTKPDDTIKDNLLSLPTF